MYIIYMFISYCLSITIIFFDQDFEVETVLYEKQSSTAVFCTC